MANSFQSLSLPSDNASVARADRIVPIHSMSLSTDLYLGASDTGVSSDPGMHIASDPKKLKAETPDKLSFIAAAFRHKLPIINLELPTGLPPLPGHPSNLKRSYSLGEGRSSFLEFHQLKEDELSSLQRQNPEFRGRLVALKGTAKHAASVEALRSFEQELRVLCHMKLKRHENIATAVFIGFNHSHDAMLGLELAEFGSLDDVLSSRALDVYLHHLAYDLALDVATGISVLHGCGIVHGDLKPANILVCRHPQRKAIAKLVDFSDSIVVQDMVGRDWQPLGGTHSWRAPECYGAYHDGDADRSDKDDEGDAGDEIYDPYKTDVYSFGLCALAILFRGDRTTRGRPRDCYLDRIQPDRNRQKRVERMKRLTGTGEIKEAYSWVSNHNTDETLGLIGKALALSCLHRSPERRMDMNSVLTFLEDSPLNMRQDSRSRAARDTVLGHALQLRDLQVAPFEGFEDTRVWDLHLFSPTDDRFRDLDPFFKRTVFQELRAASSVLLPLSQLPTVDECFLDGGFTFRDLERAFKASITPPPRPPDVGVKQFSRACEAASLLTICMMNGWGHPLWHDMPAVFSMLLSQLALAARHKSWQSAMFYSHVEWSHSDAVTTKRHNAPRRLWTAWSTLKGCQTAARILQANEPELYHKVALLARDRHGPLQDLDDPSAFVEGFLYSKPLGYGDGNVTKNVTGSRNLLAFAIYNGNLRLLQDLLGNHQFNINEKTIRWTDTDLASGEGGETPIMLAAKTQNLEIFEFLLENGADLTCTSDYGCNVLHTVSWFSDEIAAALAPTLVERGASLTALAKEYYPRGVYNPFTRANIQGSPLQWAVVSGRENLIGTLVKLCISTGTAVPDLDEVLDRATLRFDRNGLSLLIDTYSQLHPSRQPIPPARLDSLLNMSLQNPFQFYLAIFHGMEQAEAQIRTVQLLVDKGARPVRDHGIHNLTLPETVWSESSSRILNNSVIYGSVDALRAMVEHLQSEDRDIRTILKSPILFGGRDAIQRSIYCNRQSVFDYLMALVDQNLLDLDFVSTRGMTALHAAGSQEENTHYMKVLLERGCSPYTQSKDGRTPFENAIFAKNLAGARVIVESPHCNTTTLFSIVSQGGYTLFGSIITSALTNYRGEIGAEQIEFLHSIGATSNFENHSTSGDTVLHILARMWPAARSDYREFDAWLLEWLLARMPASQVQRRDVTGLTALHWMVARSNDRCVRVMLMSDKTGEDATTELTGPSAGGPHEGQNSSVLHGKTALDLALYRTIQGDLPEHIVRGGAREMRGFQERMTRLLEMLYKEQQHQSGITTTAATTTREEDVRLALETLDAKIEKVLATRLASSGSDGGSSEGEERNIVDDTDAFWPQVI